MRRRAAIAACLGAMCLPARGSEFPGPAASATVADASIHAFSLPFRGLRGAERRAFAVGNSFFNENWVAAPASTAGRDGLGPLFNAASCSSCHPRDGRGAPPEDHPGPEPLVALVLRLSIPGEEPGAPPRPEPRYGAQLQGRAILGAAPEAKIEMHYDLIEGAYADGEPFELAKPRYEISELSYGPLDPRAMISPRVAPATFGLGLLESIPQADIRARADPDDADGDGISGRAQEVPAPGRGERVLGRFGWKAIEPSLRSQTASALIHEIGITSDLFPREDLTPAQSAASALPAGGAPEIGAEKLARIEFYLRALAVPQRRGRADPQVIRGETLFGEIGCAKCHVREHRIGAMDDFPELAGAVIEPFSDLLLHDMGEGLADHRPEGEASGSEWRTPPLWGIGLVWTVNGHTRFLHDARARSLAEAILWHGGEAEASKEKFRGLPKAQRSALIRFLESL